MDKCIMLIELAKEGAAGGYVSVTLRGLASKLGVSPQTVMRWLSDFESSGILERVITGRRTRVRLTEKGLKLLEDIHDSLDSALYGGVIIGEVVSGLGEGAYYVRQYRERFREYLGFDPYPGTLNIRVIFPKTVFDALCNVKPIVIPGFVRNGRSFGDVRAYPVSVEGIDGAIVIPSRTIHPPKIAEVVSPVCIRKRLKVDDGDRVTLRVTGGRDVEG